MFQIPVIATDSIYAEDYHFPTIFKNYAARNATTYLSAPYSIWSTGRAAGKPFVISATISYPEQRFIYYPGFWFLIKWGWVQYVSVLLLFLFFFDRVKIFIYQNQLVTTMMVRPWKEEKVG